MARKPHEGHAKVYIGVWISLLMLTVITVWVSFYNFGDWNVFVAMLIATIKGALVCLYFMHLKYDNRLNQVVFISAFLFLFIFVGLTGADEFYRETERVKPVAAAGEAVDLKAMIQGSDKLLAKGKEIYSTQCFVCHGVAGKGDGPGGGTQPPARDFTSGQWRYGGGVVRVFRTITEGSAGTAMASFDSMAAEDRFGLAHFVRSFSKENVEDDPKDLEWFKQKFGEGGAPVAKRRGPRIPVDFAMKRMAVPDLSVADAPVPWPDSVGLGVGEKLYRENCLSCHGARGKGGIPVAVIQAHPAVHLKTGDLTLSKGGWRISKGTFVEFVSNGLPGRGKPGIAHFSANEWSELYTYVLGLK